MKVLNILNWGGYKLKSLNERPSTAILFVSLSLMLLAACSKEDPTDLSSLSTRSALADSIAAAEASHGITLRADTAWKDTIRSSYDDTTPAVTTSFSTNDILPDGDAGMAASRGSYHEK